MWNVYIKSCLSVCVVENSLGPCKRALSSCKVVLRSDSKKLQPCADFYASFLVPKNKNLDSAKEVLKEDAAVIGLCGWMTRSSTLSNYIYIYKYVYV